MSTDRRQDHPGALDEGALDALFAEARDGTPAPLSDRLRARLVEAALDARPLQGRPVQGQPGWWARLRAALADVGGAPSLAGVGAAGLAGVWIGFAAPGPTADLVSSVWPGSRQDWVSATDLGLAGSDLLALIDSDSE